MNAGFSNLTTLKAYLLAPALRPATDYDTAIATIGLGMADMFANHCNRDFAWNAAAADVAQGNREFWFCRRFPVASFTKVELRFFRADPWTDISGQPLASDEEKGLIHFGYTLGRSPIQVRVTYAGGYFWEQKEPTDAGYPTAVPDAITNNAAGIDAAKFLLPPSLKSAWLTQCEIVWKMRDKLGKQITDDKAGGGFEIAGLDLAPQVQNMLQPFKRYQLT